MGYVGTIEAVAFAMSEDRLDRQFQAELTNAITKSIGNALGGGVAPPR